MTMRCWMSSPLREVPDALTGTETLHRAARQGWALPAFAVYNLEMIQAIVTAAEEADRPVLVLAGSSHFHHAGQKALINMALTAAHSTSAPVGVHLDHCRDLADLQRCHPRSGTAPRHCSAVPGSPGSARGERTAARTASRRRHLVLPKSTSTLNCAAPTSPQSNGHCRRRCRKLTPSPYGRRDVPL
jgi:hypothetical protein